MEKHKKGVHPKAEPSPGLKKKSFQMQIYLPDPLWPLAPAVPSCRQQRGVHGVLLEQSHPMRCACPSSAALGWQGTEPAAGKVLYLGGVLFHQGQFPDV